MRQCIWEVLLHGKAYCVIVGSKGDNDANQGMGKGIRDNSRCLDYCHRRCLWFTEEIKGI